MNGELVQGYLLVSAIIFAIGGAGLMIRRSPLVMLMCIELMWNAANLAFITFARQWGNLDGHVAAFLVITVAAAEIAIGLAIIVVIFRRRETVDVDDMRSLSG